MHLPFRTQLLMAFVGLVVLFAAGPVVAVEIGRITDVTPSIDCKRLIIKFEGDIGPFATKKSDTPSQLSLEFEAAGLQVPRDIAKLEGKPIREIKGLKHKEGSRILLDFGRMAVPDFRVAKFDNHIVVFFGEFVPAAPPRNRASEAKGRTRSAEAKTPAKPGGRTPAVEKPSDLTVKSAEFSDGILKVELASCNSPDKVWRVDVGLDAGLQGFTSSKISAVSGSNREEAEGAAGAFGRDGKKLASGPVKGVVGKPAGSAGTVDRGSDADKPGMTMGYNLAARQGATRPSPLSTLGLDSEIPSKGGPVKQGKRIAPSE